MKKINVKKLAPFLLIGIVFFCVGGVAAMTIFSAPSQGFSLWTPEQKESEFSIISVTQKIGGKNKITVKIIVQNDGAEIFSTEIVVQAIEASGDILIEGSEITPPVDVGDTYESTIVLTQAGLVSATVLPLLIGLYDQ